MAERHKRRAAQQAAADELKEQGNAAYKAQQFTAALAHYSAAIDTCKGNKAYYTNRAMCNNRLHRYEDAVKDATTAIDIFKYLDGGKLPRVAANASARQKTNPPIALKAYLRRAEALQALGRVEDALADCAAGAELCVQGRLQALPELARLKESLLLQREEAQAAAKAQVAATPQTTGTAEQSMNAEVVAKAQKAAEENKSQAQSQGKDDSGDTDGDFLAFPLGLGLGPEVASTVRSTQSNGDGDFGDSDPESSAADLYVETASSTSPAYRAMLQAARGAQDAQGTPNAALAGASKSKSKPDRALIAEGIEEWLDLHCDKLPEPALKYARARLTLCALPPETPVSSPFSAGGKTAGQSGDAQVARAAKVADARAFLAQVVPEKLNAVAACLSFVPDVADDIKARVSTDIVVAERVLNSFSTVPERSLVEQVEALMRLRGEHASDMLDRLTKLLVDSTEAAAQFTCALGAPRVASGPLRELQSLVWKWVLWRNLFVAAAAQRLASVTDAQRNMLNCNHGVGVLTRALLVAVTVLPGIDEPAGIVVRRLQAMEQSAADPRMRLQFSDDKYVKNMQVFMATEREAAKSIDYRWTLLVRLLAALRSFAPLELARAAMLRQGVLSIVARLVHQLLQLERVILQGVKAHLIDRTFELEAFDLNSVDKYNDGANEASNELRLSKIRRMVIPAATAALAAPAQSWLSAVAVALELATRLLHQVLQADAIRADVVANGLRRPATAAAGSAADTGAGAGLQALLETLLMATSTALANDAFARETLRHAARLDQGWSAHWDKGSRSVLPTGQRLVRRGATQHLLDLTVNLTHDARVKALVQSGGSALGATLLGALRTTLSHAARGNALANMSDVAEFSVAGPEHGFGAGVPVPKNALLEAQPMLTVPTVAEAYADSLIAKAECTAVEELVARERKKLADAAAKTKPTAKGGKAGTAAAATAAATPQTQTLPPELVKKEEAATSMYKVASLKLKSAQTKAVESMTAVAGSAMAPFLDDVWTESVQTYLEGCGVSLSAIKTVGPQLYHVAAGTVSALQCSTIEVLTNLSVDLALRTRLAAPGRSAAAGGAGGAAQGGDAEEDSEGLLERVVGIVLRAALGVFKASPMERDMARVSSGQTAASVYGATRAYLKLLCEGLGLLMNLTLAAGADAAARIVRFAPVLPWVLFALMAPPPALMKVLPAGLDITLQVRIVGLLSRLAAGNLAVRDDLLARNGIGLMLGTGIAASVAAMTPDNLPPLTGSFDDLSAEDRGSRRVCVSLLSELFDISNHCMRIVALLCQHDPQQASRELSFFPAPEPVTSKAAAAAALPAARMAASKAAWDNCGGAVPLTKEFIEQWNRATGFTIAEEHLTLPPGSALPTPAAALPTGVARALAATRVVEYHQLTLRVDNSFHDVVALESGSGVAGVVALVLNSWSPQTSGNFGQAIVKISQTPPPLVEQADWSKHFTAPLSALVRGAILSSARTALAALKVQGDFLAGTAVKSKLELQQLELANAIEPEAGAAGGKGAFATLQGARLHGTGALNVVDALVSLMRRGDNDLWAPAAQNAALACARLAGKSPEAMLLLRELNAFPLLAKYSGKK